MGYESKVTLVIEMERPKGEPWNHVVASIEMGKMYYDGWRELFTEPLVGDVCLNLYGDFYVEADGTIEQGYTKEDPYGQKPTQATVKSVYKWCIKHQDPDNFELCVLTSILETAMKSPMPLKVVHTGY